MGWVYEGADGVLVRYNGPKFFIGAPMIENLLPRPIYNEQRWPFWLRYGVYRRTSDLESCSSIWDFGIKLALYREIRSGGRKA